MPKNIVVLSDGTGQEGGVGYNTNIYKTFNIIKDRTDNQIVFYDPGLGTAGAELVQQITGYGISKNIQDCYTFIFEHFESGDQIYLLGFSRGAATVRSLSSFIHYFGILPKSRPDLVGKAYKIYKIKNEAKRKAKARTFIEKHHTMWTRIKFLGCFDTVSALGFPIRGISSVLDRIPYFQHEFHNYKLSKSVEKAYHALAIDDKRKTFHPVLWDPDVEAYQTLKQVWFSGMHTDVGGGYREHELSDIPFIWLLRHAILNGLELYDHERVEITPKADGRMHDSMNGWWQSLVYQEKGRSWPKDRPDKPIIHQSVIDRVEKVGCYHPWISDMDYEVEAWKDIEWQNYQE